MNHLIFRGTKRADSGTAVLIITTLINGKNVVHIRTPYSVQHFLNFYRIFDNTIR